MQFWVDSPCERVTVRRPRKILRLASVSSAHKLSNTAKIHKISMNIAGLIN